MRITPEDIDALLPQTQCGLCGHGGCMPYAEAIVFEKAAINLCPPGGVATLKALGKLVNQDPSPYISEMKAKEKQPMLAVIREPECIGCTKCIQACPVDAIIGSSKQMHTIIASECTGCELCVPPCPVDCIDIVLTEATVDKSAQYRQRFQAREQRLVKEKQIKANLRETHTQSERQAYIQAALQRVRVKKGGK